MNNVWLFRWICILAISIAISSPGCTSVRAVDQGYHEEIHDQPQLAVASSTTVVFVIDGLSAALLAAAIESGHAKSLQAFFTDPPTGTSPFRLARASFPTLTFPNLTSILTGESVGEHGIIGNRVLAKDGSVIDFQEVQNWDELYHRTKNATAFSFLTEVHETAVNFSFPFSDAAGTTVDQTASVQTGLDYLSQDYAAIDHETEASLETLLSKTKVEIWPRFIFVHLIGVDALEHEFGPNDGRVQQYFNDLDNKLQPIFNSIVKAENSAHAVTTVLTADHGFVEIANELQVVEEVKKIDDGVRVIADNRVAPLYTPSEWTPDMLHDFEGRLRSLPHVAWIVARDGSGLNVTNTNGSQWRIDYSPGNCRYSKWMAQVTRVSTSPATGSPGPESSPNQCVEDFDQDSSSDFLSFMVPGLVEYFTGSMSPNLILVADDNSEFSGDYHGNHGGLTDGEVHVPLLSRHADLPPGLPTSQLLRALHLLSD